MVRRETIHLHAVPLSGGLVEVEWKGTTLVAASPRPLRDAADVLLCEGVPPGTEIVAMHAGKCTLHWRGGLGLMRRLPDVYDRGFRNRDEEGYTQYQRYLQETPFSAPAVAAEDSRSLGERSPGSEVKRPAAGSAGALAWMRSGSDEP